MPKFISKRICANCFRYCTIAEPIDTDKDGNQLTLMDIVADDKSIIEQIDLILATQQLYELIGECLEGRELEIIVLRYGLFSHTSMTQKEIAKKLGISRSYVSRIEKKALEKLKKCLYPRQGDGPC